MNAAISRLVRETESVCPVCLARIPAQYLQIDHEVYLEKTCPHHGAFRAIAWRDAPAMETWVRPKTAAHPQHPFTTVQQGCPYDCGLCAEHRQQTCCVLFEVTLRCNLTCPVCFAEAGGSPLDPSLEQIEGWFQRLLSAGGPYNIQLSGGEPCMRDDLPQIIRLGKAMGFSFFQLNTNGLRLAHDPAYLHALVQAGLSTVFLQFDGVDDAVYRRLRGRAILADKMRAIENCTQAGVGVMLVPTLVPGVNTQQIGAVIRLALAHTPVVRGVHFQPISYFGRYPQFLPASSAPGEAPTPFPRITLPEIITQIESQTNGLIQAHSFLPPGGENALCSFHGNFVHMPDGSLPALTRRSSSACCSAPEDGALGATRSREFVARTWAAPQIELNLPVLNGASLGASLGGWDTFIERARTHTFCLSGMAFQDAWNLDLERLKDCYIHVMSPDGRLVPFCAYNLTSQAGRSLYRGQAAGAAPL